MARKHNTKHLGRGRSHYPERLAKRGLSKAPALADPDQLRRTQQAREARGLPPWRRGAWEAA